MKDKYAILVACAENGVIGNMCKLPWHIPDDLKRFKNMTVGSTIIMGSTTFKSIGVPLPDRETIVITSGRSKLPQGDYKKVSTIDEAIYTTRKNDKVFVCGGESIYTQFLDRNIVDRIYMTLVNGNPEGDRLFPINDINEKTGWKLSSKEVHETHTYFIFDKIN